MKHSEVKRRFPDYLRGTIEGRLLQELEAHLRQCESCRKELESVSRLDSLLRQEVPAYRKQVEPSPSLMAKLDESRLEEARARPGLRRPALARRRSLPLGIALGGLVLVAAIFLMPPVREYVGDIFGIRKVIGPEPTPQVTPVPTEVSAVRGDLTLTLRLSRTTYAVSERAMATVKLTNTSPQAIQIAAPGKEYLNLIVQDEGGQEIFNWLLNKYGSLPAGPMETLTLDPGGSITRSLEFAMPEEGTFKVIATRFGDSLMTPPVNIEAVK